MATNRPKLKFLRGSTYTFDVSNADLATHPFKFTADSGSTEYTSGVTLTGTQGQSGAEITFVVPNDAPTNLNYYCGTHGMGMGNHIFIPPFPEGLESDGSFFGSYRSHFNVTAGSGTLYGGTGNSGTVYFMAIDEGVPATNESDGSFFTDSDMTVTTDSDTQYGGGYGLVFNIEGPGTISYLGDRGFHAGGNGSTFNIGYFDITTSANTAYFGDMQGKFSQMGGVGDGARIVTMGGYDNNKSPPRSDQIQYWASATTGNALDFGNLTQVKEKTDGVVGDATRAVVGGGYGASNSVVNEMDYITIQTTGNAQDFGDLTQARDECGNTNDATRGVFIGGEISGQVNTIDYITTQTPANATDFGDTTNSVYGCHSGICADETRGLYMGGITSGNSFAYDTIEYLTIQTTGNGTDFGDMDNGRSGVSACSNGTTGVIMGGFAYPTGPSTQYMQKVTIQTTGNATDFGGTIYGSGSHTQDGAGMSGNAA